MEPDLRPRLAVSACLTGRPVRYDGGHKWHAFVNEVLSHYVELVPVCPEEAIGLGTPREPIRLVRYADGLHAVGARTAGLDVTARLRAFAAHQGEALTGIAGYVLKGGSPSCGPRDVPVVDTAGASAGSGPGVYAQAFTAEQPLVPVADERTLDEPAAHEHFLERVYALARCQRLLSHGPSPAALVDFHTRHKFLVMAHSVSAYQRLGRLVAQAHAKTIEATTQTYVGDFLRSLEIISTRGRHTNVLQHLSGLLRGALTRRERDHLQALIEAYRSGQRPLSAPVSVLRAHAREYGQLYVQRQFYLAPYPDPLGPRSAV